MLLVPFYVLLELHSYLEWSHRAQRDANRAQECNRDPFVVDGFDARASRVDAVFERRLPPTSSTVNPGRLERFMAICGEFVTTKNPRPYGMSCAKRCVVVPESNITESPLIAT